MCVEAGLINESHAGGFRKNLTDDVQRLYSFFDVALENNLVSLINHCILLYILFITIHNDVIRYYLSLNFLTNATDVTDVCMDESAVSSDPVLAFLLDEVVVKDWCKKKFDAIISHLHGICILDDFIILMPFLYLEYLILFYVTVSYRSI